MDTTPANDTARAAATRQALISAALKLFGERGYDGTSIRAIAAGAKVNSAMIDYHFGSKAGLRRACAETIAARLSQALRPALEAGQAAVTGAAAAQQHIEAIIETMARFLLANPETENFVPFILREIAHPGDVVDIVYERVFLPVHRHVCGLWAVASGTEAGSAETRLAVFSMIGQLVYFRIGRELVMRRMGWTALDAGHANEIAAILRANVGAAIAARREVTP